LRRINAGLAPVIESTHDEHLQATNNVRGPTAGIVVGAVMTIVLAAGCGGTPATGSVVGTIAFDRRHFGVVVHVFDANRAQVASDDVPPRDDRFRFDLPPGQYALQLTKPSAPVTCDYEKAVSVRASRTTHVNFVASILTPGCGTY
jgi:hypothetical protein